MAHYSLTPRVSVLAERFHAQASMLCTEHASALNALERYRWCSRRRETGTPLL